MRCIYLLPDVLNEAIQAFRTEHDPLAKLIDPHVTLVFPFDSEISDTALIEHISSNVAGALPISASLPENAVASDSHIYFPLDLGAQSVRELHDRLYSSTLESLLLPIPYIPHITIGRVSDGNPDNVVKMANSMDLKQSDVFKMSKIIIERIGTQGESSVIREFRLGVD